MNASAEAAPEGVTAPDARYNLVQWVPWDNAGFAYADILVDPQTDALHELSRFPALSGKTWNPHCLAGEYLLVRNDKEAACFRLPVE